MSLLDYIFLIGYSDIELVVIKCKSFEKCLRQDFNAQGNGLGELRDSVKEVLPDETLDPFDKVIKIRNEIIHEKERNRLENRYEFIRLCKNLEELLDKSKKMPNWKLGCSIMVFFLAFALYFLFQNPP